jgi:hypothetical protein
MLASITRDENGVQRETNLCLPLPHYDLFFKSFWFSTCWRWSCLESSFRAPNPTRLKPYTITCVHRHPFYISTAAGHASACSLPACTMIIHTQNECSPFSPTACPFLCELFSPRILPPLFLSQCQRDGACEHTAHAGWYSTARAA